MEEHKLNDKEIRNVILRQFSGRNEEQRLVEEFSMGDSRADLLLITKNKLAGLEIKSDRDTFARLERQINDYERYFDMNYLVVGTYHVEEAMRTVPGHWGIIEVYEQANGELALECVRNASLALKDNIEEKLTLLWRNELMRIISEYRLSKAVLHRKDKMIWKIRKGLSSPVIQTEVCAALLSRDYSKYDRKTQ